MLSMLARQVYKIDVSSDNHILCGSAPEAYVHLMYQSSQEEYLPQRVLNSTTQTIYEIWQANTPYSC